MALPQKLETLEPIPLPDLRRPAQMPCLPEWVASRAASLSDERQRDTNGRYRKMPTLSPDCVLSRPEREEIERHMHQLQKACAPTPANDPSAEEAMLVIVTKLMLVLPAAKQNEASAEARGEAFMAALDDVPLWAVQSAVRHWYRGECGEEFDYHWCPAPAELRRLALRELWHVNNRIWMLDRILRAAPRITYSDEHCATMRARLANLKILLDGKTVAAGGISTG